MFFVGGTVSILKFFGIGFRGVGGYWSEGCECVGFVSGEFIVERG